jgi:ADP-ribose pyrophosphatase YjhB (NUDIX family)
VTASAPPKPIKRAVAIVVKNADGDILCVLRPEDDSSLPGVWGLPAVQQGADESEEEAAVRAGRVKLGVEVRVVRLLGRGVSERRTYYLHLADYEVEVVRGVPTVPQPDTRLSQYVDLQYVQDLSLLFPAARQGSVCARVLLDALEISWK